MLKLQTGRIAYDRWVRNTSEGRAHMFVFCSGGETIKNINQQSGAHVELQRNPPPNTDPNVRIFSIRGSPQQMEMARQLIDEKIGVSDRFLFEQQY